MYIGTKTYQDLGHGADPDVFPCFSTFFFVFHCFYLFSVVFHRGASFYSGGSVAGGGSGGS